MRATTATLLGFFAASALPAVYFAAATPLSGESDLPFILGWLFVFYYFSAAATAIVGLPAYFALKRFNLVAWWSATGCGGLAGTLTIVALTSNSSPADKLRFALLGSAAGLLFWSIWRLGHR